MPKLPATPTASDEASGPEHGPGRKASITRDDLTAAALRLIGPHRSLSSLGLREVTREAGIAPNSFYRQFRDMDELAVAMIELAGASLRRLVGAARLKVGDNRHVVRSSLEMFMKQLRADDRFLQLLLREGSVGSDAYRQAVERQLQFFERELCSDLVRFAERDRETFHEPQLIATAITRLVFAMGATAMDSSPDHDAELIDDLTKMVTMIIIGGKMLHLREAAQQMARQAPQP